MGYTLHISEEEIDKQASTILRLVKFGENGIGLCYPGCFIGYNLHAFTASPTILRKYLGTYYHKYFFIPIELHADDTYDSVWKTVKAYILETSDRKLLPQTDTLLGITKSIVNHGMDPYFFITNAHLVPDKILSDILREFHIVITEVSRVGLQVFTEANIYDEKHTQMLAAYHRIQHNRTVFPVYSKKESRLFIQTLMHTWHMDQSRQIVDTILEICGGYLWILREAVRYVRDSKKTTKDSILRYSRIHERASYIFHLLDQRVIHGMSRLCIDQKTDIPPDVFQFLMSTGLVEKLQNVFSPTCPLFLEYLTESNTSSQLRLSKTKTILYQEQAVQHLFGSSERTILSLLLSKRGSVVNRDEIANAVWGSECVDTYSDWAIDKSISRIRQTLTNLGLSKNTISTKKRQGFILI